MISFQHRVRRNEQTERVCAVYASLIPTRRARFARENMVTPAPTPRHARTTPARARTPTHARRRPHHTFQTSEQLPDSVSAQSTKHEQQARRTDVMRQATNRDGIQLCVKTLQMTMKTTQAVKCRRLARPKSLPSPKKKTLWNVPSTDVIAVTRKNRKKLTEKTKTHRQLSSDS